MFEILTPALSQLLGKVALTPNLAFEHLYFRAKSRDLGPNMQNFPRLRRAEAHFVF